MPITWNPAPAISMARGRPTYPRPITAAVAFRFSSLSISCCRLRYLPCLHLRFARPAHFEFLNVDIVFLYQLVEIQLTYAELSRGSSSYAFVWGKGLTNKFHFHRFI